MIKLKDLLTDSYNWMKYAATNEDDDATPGVSRNDDSANQNSNDPNDSQGNKSVAAQKADALNLVAKPYGMYADQSGKVVAKSVKGGAELVRIAPHDDENPDSGERDSSGAGHFKDDDFTQQPSQTGYNDTDLRNNNRGDYDQENPDYTSRDSSGASHFKDDDFSLEPSDAEQNKERNNAAMFHQAHAAGQKEIPDKVDTVPVDVGTSAKEKEPPGYKVNNDPNVGLHGSSNVDPSVPKSSKLKSMMPPSDNGNLFRQDSIPHHPDYAELDSAPSPETPEPETPSDPHHNKLAKGVLSKANYDYDLARRSLYKALVKHPERGEQYKKIAAELQRLEKDDTSVIDALAKQIKLNRAEKIKKSREKYPQARINPNKDL